MSPPLIAIVGRPNVGKSTLFNRLISRRQALVEDRPGITRDRQYGEVFWDGHHFRIVDTGGLTLHDTDPLHRKMTAQAIAGLKEADGIIFLLDGRSGLTPEDWEWIEWQRSVKKPKIFVINKIDSEKVESQKSEFYELGVEPIHMVSAETGRGINSLLDEVVRHLPESSKAAREEEDEPEDKPAKDKSFKICIIGRPNVGKSSLLNYILKEDRAIVHDMPGTTRDPVNSYFEWKGKEYTLIDTAGIRKRGKIREAIEKISIIKALGVVEEADLALMMIDGDEGLTDQDAHVAGEAFSREKAMLLLVNKWDLAVKEHTPEEFTHRMEVKLRFSMDHPTLFVSAKTGKGLDKLFPMIEKMRVQYEQRVSTGKLNAEFERIIGSHPLPVHAGKNIKIYFATQISVKPPTFVVFSNEPRHIHFSYKRYLVNALKEAFGFELVPIRIIFRKKG